MKSLLHMNNEVDTSELTKVRGEKLQRVKVTVQIFSQEIVLVMLTVKSKTNETGADSVSIIGEHLSKIINLL